MHTCIYWAKREGFGFLRMSDIIKYQFWGHLRLNVIYCMLVAVTAIFNMHVCVCVCVSTHAPMCRLRLTLDFIAALISCVETL